MSKNIIKKIDKGIKNIIAEIGYFFITKFNKFPQVATLDETINKLISDKCSIARFGDGEIKAMGNLNISFQKADKQLASRLEEIINSNEENILIGLPDVFSYEDINRSIKKRRLFYKKELILYYKYYKKINIDKKYYNTHISRPYMEYKDKSIASSIFENIKKIWKDRDIIIVEGEGTRLGIENDLFYNVKSIKRILCPSIDAFDKYEEILKECKKINKDKLFIIAVGPTATVLAYDLAKLGYQAIDIGHLDIEYEWFRMGTTKKVKIKGKFTNETKDGRIVEKIDNKEYEKQIISKIL